jgi:hypothetical protein
MAKKVLIVVFTIECVVLAVLLCREWTVYYIDGGRAESDYENVYRDKIEAGHHPVTADIDAGTTSFAMWWGGTLCIFFGVALGGPSWAYGQLWPHHAAHIQRAAAAPAAAFAEPYEADVPPDENGAYGDEHDAIGAM